MDLVEIIAEVLKYVAPALLVLLGMKYMVDSQRNREADGALLRLKGDVLKEHLPLMLSAHERAILFLERISPEQLLARHSGRDKTAEEFRGELIAQIRSEYEHNLVQQLYISHEGWALLRQAREEILGLIHQSAEQLEEGSNGHQLARKVLEKAAGRQDMMYQKAIFVMKRDIRRYFEMGQSTDDE